MRRQMSDAAHFLRRSREEARLALLTEEPAVAAAHHGLSIQYAVHARQHLQARGPTDRSVFPQFGEPKADLITPEALKARTRTD